MYCRIKTHSGIRCSLCLVDVVLNASTDDKRFEYKSILPILLLSGLSTITCIFFHHAKTVLDPFCHRFNVSFVVHSHCYQKHEINFLDNNNNIVYITAPLKINYQGYCLNGPPGNSYFEESFVKSKRNKLTKQALRWLAFLLSLSIIYYCFYFLHIGLVLATLKTLRRFNIDILGPIYHPHTWFGIISKCFIMDYKHRFARTDCFNDNRKNFTKPVIWN